MKFEGTIDLSFLPINESSHITRIHIHTIHVAVVTTWFHNIYIDIDILYIQYTP